MLESPGANQKAGKLEGKKAGAPEGWVIRRLEGQTAQAGGAECQRAKRLKGQKARRLQAKA